jgi:hypothetical protein
VGDLAALWASGLRKLLILKTKAAMGILIGIRLVAGLGCMKVILKLQACGEFVPSTKHIFQILTGVWAIRLSTSDPPGN